MVLDNCEHLLDASTALITGLLAACPALTLLTTSREPIGVAGEVSWRVPSLSLADEAIELFTRPRPPDQARIPHHRRQHRDGHRDLSRDSTAFRWRSNSPRPACAPCRRPRSSTACTTVPPADRRSPHRSPAPADLARIGGLVARTAVRARTGVVPEAGGVLRRVRSRRRTGCHRRWRGRALSGARPTHPAGRQVARRSPTTVGAATRYRLLETVRQYAQEKLGESREGDVVRARHRDHYTAEAALLDGPDDAEHERRIEWAEAEMDNLRAAFAWSLETIRTPS